MTFDPDIAGDALLVDGLETVTLIGTATITVAGAKRSALADSETELAGQLVGENLLNWQLPASSLAGTVPRPGDTIVAADATQWTIASANLSPLTQVWRAVCRQQR